MNRRKVVYWHYQRFRSSILLFIASILIARLSSAERRILSSLTFLHGIYMKSNTRLAILGGTGKAGKFLVSELIRRGFRLKLLMRGPDPALITNPLVGIVKGDARDHESVQSLVRDCECVMSTLGQPKGESSIFSQATQNVIAAMNAHQVRRYIVITGLNVDMPSDRKSDKTRKATEWMKENYPATTNDKQAEAGMLSASNLDWTLIRLPRIVQTDERFQTRVSLDDCPGDTISAADLATFMIQQLFDDIYIRKAPFIANP